MRLPELQITTGHAEECQRIIGRSMAKQAGLSECSRS